MSKKNIYLMYAIACLQGMVFYGPIASLYRQVQSITVFEITLIESISLVLCLLLELPWGIVADFLSFLLERILLSVAISGFSGVDISILYLSAQKEDGQKVFGIYDGLSTFGLLAAAFLYSAVIGAADRATALSINAVIIDSAGIGTNLIYGALADRSLTAALVSGAILCVAGFCFIETGKRGKYNEGGYEARR